MQGRAGAGSRQAGRQEQAGGRMGGRHRQARRGGVRGADPYLRQEANKG